METTLGHLKHRLKIKCKEKRAGNVTQGWSTYLACAGFQAQFPVLQKQTTVFDVVLLSSNVVIHRPDTKYTLSLSFTVSRPKRVWKQMKGKALLTGEVR